MYDVVMGLFVKGQIPWNKGKPRTKEEKLHISLAKKGKKNPLLEGNKNPMWKKDRNIGYGQRHRQMAKELGKKPEKCTNCGKNPGFTKDGKSKIQWANISGKYLLIKADWIALCISCHKKFDKIVRNFHK